MTDSIEELKKEIEELRKQRADLDARLQKRTWEIVDLKRRICDELCAFPAYALLETLISLRKSYICKDQEEE